MSLSNRPVDADFKPRTWMTAAMIRKGYSQFSLAKAVGVSQAAIALIECGARDPSMTMAKKICLVLGEDAAKFIAETENAG